MRYLAVDYGGSRMGLAVCDRDEKIASPLAVLENPGQFLNRIVEVVRNEGIEAVVMGLPLNMDDSEGPQANLVRKFAAQLEKAVVNIPIHFQDERLSTFAAEEKLLSAEFTRKRKKKRLDAVAAAEILHAFLEQKHQH